MTLFKFDIDQANLRLSIAFAKFVKGGMSEKDMKNFDDSWQETFNELKRKADQ